MGGGTDAIRKAREVLDIEIAGLAAARDRVGDAFVRAVEILHDCTGKVIVTGVGKSGLVCHKIAATLASTGTPSFFLHAAEASHGDLGMIMRDDVVLAVSNSGESEEVLKMLPLIKRWGLKLIAMTGNRHSSLALSADVILDVRPHVLIMQSPYTRAHQGRPGVTADDHTETALATIEVIEEERLLIDLRTVEPKDDAVLVAALRASCT